MEKKLKIGGGTEKYLKPEMEVIAFEREDVIVTSGCNPVDTCGGGILAYDPTPCSSVEPR